MTFSEHSALDKSKFCSVHLAYMRNVRLTLSLTLFISLVISLAIIPAQATLVITVWSPHKILVAADGMSIQPDIMQPYKQQCKIRQAASDCFFSIVGMQDDKQNQYDLAPYAIQACRMTGSITQRAQFFQTSSLAEIQREWKHIKHFNPNSYRVLKEHGSAHLAVVFAGGHPLELAIIQFIENSKGQMVPDVPLLRNQSRSTAVQRDEVGEYLKIEAYRSVHHEIDREPDIFWVHDVISKAIDLEQGEALREIGPPISVLEITDQTARRIEPGNCPPIQ